MQNSQVARHKNLISAKTPLTKRTSRRPPLTAHPNPPRLDLDARQCNDVHWQRTKRPGRAHGKFQFSGLSRDRDRRPQATAAGDRRRPQATAGDRRRASASAAKNEQARLHGTKTPPRLIPATWGFAHERAAEMGGGEWIPSRGGSAQRPGRMWWEDPPASSSCAPPELSRSRNHQSRGIGSRQRLERPRTAHDPTRQSLLAAVRRLRSANERARTCPRTKQKGDTQRPPRPFNTRTDRESNRPRDGRERDRVRAPQRCAVARLLACWWRFRDVCTLTRVDVTSAQ